jgi:hypothetical protein
MGPLCRKTGLTGFITNRLFLYPEQLSVAASPKGARGACETYASLLAG